MGNGIRPIPNKPGHFLDVSTGQEIVLFDVTHHVIPLRLGERRGPHGNQKWYVRGWSLLNPGDNSDDTVARLIDESRGREVTSAPLGTLSRHSELLQSIRDKWTGEPKDWPEFVALHLGAVYCPVDYIMVPNAPLRLSAETMTTFTVALYVEVEEPAVRWGPQPHDEFGPHEGPYR